MQNKANLHDSKLTESKPSKAMAKEGKPKTTLLILAAGIGSRFGGIKQIEPVGPNGEIILDYSIYDAIRAGFTKIVFVIRKDIEESFRQKISPKAASQIEIDFAYQQLDSGLMGFPVPEGRQKPWGTGHAVLVAEDKIHEPFAAINADDYYGQSAFTLVNKHLVSLCRGRTTDYAMVGFPLANTLSDFGTVSRGICETNSNSYLERITERTKLTRKPNGASFTDEAGMEHFISGDTPVSMNYWGFGPDIFDYLKKEFKEFLTQKSKDLKAEYYLPFAVGGMINAGLKKVAVLPAEENWFGITYKEDLPTARIAISEKIRAGVYPDNLWG
jgi:UTP-glucose-1-phosphate uridylyltransferase